MNRKTKARAWRKKQHGRFDFKVKMSDESIRLNNIQKSISILSIIQRFNSATEEQLLELENLRDERDELIKSLYKNS